jgi:hypothetical protein
MSNGFGQERGNITVMTTSPPDYLDLAEVAEIVGVQYRTLRNYHQTAERNRRLAAKYDDPSFIRPGDLPKPDKTFGRSPVWLPATIEAWMAHRPGQGIGGGRPLGWSPNQPAEPETSDDQPAD